MLTDIAHARVQSLLRHRTLLLLGASGSLLLNAALGTALASRDREVILQPIATRPLAVSTAGVSAEYLELVTRDVALLLLNRSPQALDYWMEQVLKLAAPDAYGSLKAALVRIVAEQRGSDVSQAFVITGLKVDPDKLTSVVDGDLKTFVGEQVIATERRRFQFGWVYTGLRLSLASFTVVPSSQEQAR